MYSSFKAYITNNGNKVTTQDLVMEMISDEGSVAKKEYKRFVEAEIGHEPDNPLLNVYGGIIHGARDSYKKP